MSRYIDLEELEKRINDNIKPETLEEKALIEWCKDECIRQGYAMPTANVAPIADTVSELQNRLAKSIGTYTDKSFVYVNAWFKLIDQIAKEMIEGESDANNKTD